MAEHYADRLEAAIRAKGTPAVVGIDPILERLPGALRGDVSTAAHAAAAFEAFGQAVVDIAAPVVPAIKLNLAFFEALQEAGVAAYFRLVAYARRAGLLVIGDIKRGDIGSTAELYARGHLDPRAADDPDRVPDAVTLAGYLGASAVRPFIERASDSGKGVYVLVRPSDPGADAVHEFGNGGRFYEHMARLVSSWGSAAELIGSSGLSCVGAVVAPKDDASTRRLRSLLESAPLLVPGYGAQCAGAEACRACFRADGTGAVVNASRSVIYAFEHEEALQHFGDDWRAAIAEACGRFARDVAVCLERSPA